MKEIIDWAKVRKERRVKNICVDQADIEGYLLINKLPATAVVRTWDLSDDWMIAGVSYDLLRGSFIFMILSPDFEPVLEGSQFETMLATQHVVKVTKKQI